MDGDDRDRKVILRHLEPVLDRDVVRAGRRARPRAPSGPAQNSTQARPQSARALRGSSRSRHSRCSRSSKARASSLLDAGASVLTTASVASCTSCSPPTAVAKSCGLVGQLRRLRVAGEPAEHRPAPRGRALRSTSSSSSLGELERRARVLERCTTLPEAGRPREPAVDDRLERRARGRLAQRFLEQRERARSTLSSSARRTSASARNAPIFRLGQQVGRNRPGARPLPGGVVRASRSERPTMAVAAAAGGVSRSACSASSAATADAPRSAASVAASSSTPRDLGVRRVRRQREVTRAERAGRRRSPRSVRERSAAPRRDPGRGPTTSSGWVKRIVPFSRSITCAATAGSSASGATPARSRSDSEGVPNAEASASASRVDAGSPEILARTSSSSVSGTGSG